MMKTKIENLEKRLGELLRKPNKTKTEVHEMNQLDFELDVAYIEDEKPLVEELVKGGFDVTSAWDFVNTDESYPDALPILLKHLNLPYHVKIKEGIIRSLIVKEMKGKGCKEHLKEFYNPDYDLYLKWVIGLAVEMCATKEYIPELIEIIKNDEYDHASVIIL